MSIGKGFDNVQVIAIDRTGIADQDAQSITPGKGERSLVNVIEIELLHMGVF